MQECSYDAAMEYITVYTILQEITDKGIGVGRFWILWGGGGARFRILGGGARGGGKFPAGT